MSACFCGNKVDFKECCGPYLEGQKLPPTAEATMRSRYSAYCKGAIAYLKNTQHPSSAKEFDEQGTKEWAQSSKWLGLQILSTKQGGADDQSGVVEFKAKYSLDNVEHTHHEISDFKKEEGHWYFVDGKVMKTPLILSSPKIGRNDPCSCGSGKKYKKCCAA